MADVKKYLNLEQLGYYDEKIKKVISDGDATALSDAKAYSDSLATNYDPAGTAQTKVNELANGSVKANTEAIAKLNGDASTTGSVAKAVADAKATIDADVDAVEAKADANKSDIDTMKGQIAALEAGTYDDSEVRGLIQTNADDIDAVEAKVNTLVGTDTGKSVRAITLEEVAKILNDSDPSDVDTLEEIAAWIAEHPDSVAELNAKISGNTQAIDRLTALVGTLPEGETSATVVAYVQKLVNAEQTRAEGVESGLENRLKTVEGNIGTGTVDSRIATAKQEAINAAATDATTKAGNAETAAKAYTDEKIAEFTPITTSEIDALFA